MSEPLVCVATQVCKHQGGVERSWACGGVVAAGAQAAHQSRSSPNLGLQAANTFEALLCLTPHSCRLACGAVCVASL
jgi:hypothetical protein